MSPDWVSSSDLGSTLLCYIGINNHMCSKGSLFNSTRLVTAARVPRLIRSRERTVYSKTGTSSAVCSRPRGRTGQETDFARAGSLVLYSLCSVVPVFIYFKSFKDFKKFQLFHINFNSFRAVYLFHEIFKPYFQVDH
jgi:hypothetical protein